MRQPDPEGTRFVGPPVDQFGRLEKYELRVGNAESLVAMQEQYVFFTPAVLYLHARLTDAPLIDAVCEFRQNIKFYHKKFNQPIFRGLHTRNGNVDWNHVLWAVEREYWHFVFNFIASLTLSNATTKTLVRVGGQTLLITDPLAADRQGTGSPIILPRLEISAFGINGNTFQAGLVAGLREQDPPVLRFFPPGEDMKVFAAAYYSGHNPLNVRANFLAEQKLKEDNRGDKT
jgi:hypothetical protein